MTAARTPMLGMIVAVVLLVAENFGANAYRTYYDESPGGVNINGAGQEQETLEIEIQHEHRGPGCSFGRHTGMRIADDGRHPMVWVGE